VYHKNIDFCDDGHIIGTLTIKLYNKLMEPHRETAQNPEKHVGQLLPHVQRRAAGRHVLTKKPASAGFFVSADDEGEMKGAAFCYYGGL